MVCTCLCTVVFYCACRTLEGLIFEVTILSFWTRLKEHSIERSSAFISKEEEEEEEDEEKRQSGINNENNNRILWKVTTYIASYFIPPTIAVEVGNRILQFSVSKSRSICLSGVPVRSPVICSCYLIIYDLLPFPVNTEIQNWHVLYVHKYSAENFAVPLSNPV